MACDLHAMALRRCPRATHSPDARAQAPSWRFSWVFPGVKRSSVFERIASAPARARGRWRATTRGTLGHRVPRGPSNQSACLGTGQRGSDSMINCSSVIPAPCGGGDRCLRDGRFPAQIRERGLGLRAKDRRAEPTGDAHASTSRPDGGTCRGAVLRCLDLRCRRSHRPQATPARESTPTWTPVLASGPSSCIPKSRGDAPWRHYVVRFGNGRATYLFEGALPRSTRRISMLDADILIQITAMGYPSSEEHSRTPHGL
jgi:hypothetical protein